MSASFSRKRDLILKQLWAAQDRAAPDYESPELSAAGEIAANELERLLSEHSAAQSAVEVGLTWRYLGDAWFCAAVKTNQDYIQRSLAAYQRAEELLSDSGRELDLAKLRFNHGNALCQVAGAANFPALHKAKKLYHSALLTFRELQTDGVAVTEASLRDVVIALQAHEIFNWAERDRDRAGDLRRKLEATSPNDDLELRRQISREVEGMKADPLTEQSRSFLNTLAYYRPTKERMRFEEQLPAYDALGAEIRPRLPDESDEVLKYLRQQLTRVLEVPDLAAERRDSISRLLGEVEMLSRQAPQTPEAAIAVRAELRDLVRRMKPLLTSAARPRRS